MTTISNDVKSFQGRVINHYLKENWPIRANVELTKLCNFQCLHCYQLDTRASHRSYLPFSEWEKLFHQMRESNVMLLRILGGEPTLHPDFIAIYKCAIEMGFAIEIQTNGSLMSKEVVNTMMKYPPKRLRMSVYGFSQETYSKFCKNNKGYELVRGGIDQVLKAKIPLSITAILTRQNVADMEILALFCKEHNLPMKLTTTIAPSSGGDNLSERLQFSYNEIEDFSDDYPSLKKLLADQRKGKLASKDWGEDDVINCWGGKLGCSIDEMHNMTTCAGIYDVGYSIRELGFKEAWHCVNQTRRDFIEIPNPCTFCQHREYCGKCSAFFHGFETPGDALNVNNCQIKGKGLPLNKTTQTLPFEHPDVQALVNSSYDYNLTVLNNIETDSPCNSGSCGCH